jgi:predicted dehydrogenase
MMDPVRLAMVGCGSMAGAHRKAMEELWRHDLRVFRVVAVCDVQRERAEAMAEAVAAFQGERPAVYTDMLEMLAREPRIEAVDIVTLHRLHHTLAVPCLEAGKHVTLEKPLGITLRTGRRIIEAAERNGVLLQVAENYRRAPHQRAIRWALEQGRIGVPRMIYWLDVGERLWYWRWREHLREAGGGWTLDGGVHFADLFRYHLGEVESVYAEVRAFLPYRYGRPETLEEPIEVDVEDTTAALLRFHNGVLGQWVSTTAAPGKKWSQRVIYGEEGSLDFKEGLRTRTQTVPMEQLVAEHQAALSEEEKERLFPRGITDTVATELYEFFLAVRGEAELEVDGWEGYRSQALCEAVYESGTLGRPVALRDIEALRIEVYQNRVHELIGEEP